MADSNKTEQATPRQRQEARGNGPGNALARTERRAGDGRGRRRAVLHGTRGRPRWTHFLPHTSRSRQLRLDRARRPASVLDERRSDALGFPDSARAAWWCRLLAGLAQGGFVFAPEALRSRSSGSAPPSKLQPDVFARRAQHHPQIAYCHSPPFYGSALRAFAATGERSWAALMPMRGALPV